MSFPVETSQSAPIGLAPDLCPADASRPDAAARQVVLRTFVAAVLAHIVADSFGMSVWPVYKKLAGLDLALAGLIATIVNMAGTATQPFFGLWADRRGRRGFILLGTLLTALALLLGPLTPFWPAIDRAMPRLFGLPGSYLIMLVILLAGRLGQDMFHPAGAGVAGGFSERRRSTFVAMFVAFGSIGYGLSQIAFSGAYQAFAGHTELLLLPGAIMWAMIWRWCRPAIPPSAGQSSIREAIGQLRPAAGHLLVLFLILALSAGVNVGLFFLMPEFMAQRGYPKWLGLGGAFGLIILGSTLMMIPMGHLADQIGRRRMLLIMMVLAAVSYHAIVRLPTMPVPAFVTLCIVGGAFLGTVNPLGVAFGQRLAPRNVSMVSALMMGLAWCLGSTSPSLVGYFVDKRHVEPATVLMWLGTGNVVMVGLGLLLPESREVPQASI